ncbi:MAG TPA: PHP domain-containing protein [Aldersonia sp.]
MRIDLHTHSSVSDGTDTPADLLRKAHASGLDVVALTDHDTTGGWAEAESTLDELPASFALVRGMEMSCTADGEDGAPVPVHLLAYLFDPSGPGFRAERARLREERERRVRAMAENIAADYPQIDPDAILGSVGTSAGRPHIARALVAAGIVDSVDEAFASLLSRGSRYYVEKQDTPVDAAVELIAAAGGVSVLAHVRARKRGRLMTLDHVRRLAAHGLGGLEVDHPDHSADDRALLGDLAAELDLLTLGSSDYHGSNKTIEIGTETTDPEQYAALVARAGGIGVLAGGQG